MKQKQITQKIHKRQTKRKHNNIMQTYKTRVCLQTFNKNRGKNMEPLSTKHRPNNLNQICGQEHLIGTNGIITNMIKSKAFQHSCIFYGPPGCGKTTIANIIAENANMEFKAFNATNTGLSEIKDAVKNKTNTSIMIYLDEIQYFNKKQQQSLLPYIESGEIILIAATTDNPYHCCYKALLSRCTILEFKPVKPSDMITRLKEITNLENKSFTDDAIQTIANNAAGDMRRALNIIDIAILQYQQQPEITSSDIEQILPSTRMATFDTDGDDHYGLISALQKSIRGSDPDAAIFYLARLLEAGDILSPCRRLTVMANEDIGLANPDAIPFTYACCQMAQEIGLPEAKLPLTNAVLYLALSPKSSTCENTYNPAAADVQAGKGNIIPEYLRNACSKGYLFPHDYPNHWIKQQYLPDDLKHTKYYHPEDNVFENEATIYWNDIKQEPWTCVNCKSKNDYHTKFCGQCGTKKTIPEY